MVDHDYCVLDTVDDDVILLEWDMAVGQEELTGFIDRVRANRDAVLVAPYRLYEAHSGRPAKPQWAHRRYVHNAMFTEFISPGDEYCHLFGLGMAYLPRALVRKFLDEWSGHFNDVTFSAWHHRTAAEPNVHIDWSARPTHVHYDISRIAKGLD